MVEVIENLIENAIEHNRLLAPAERFIIVTMTTNEKQHRFAVENPAEDLTLPLSELYLPGRTTKTGSHQGLGLASIRQILSENQIHFAGAHDTDAGTVRFPTRSKSEIPEMIPILKISFIELVARGLYEVHLTDLTILPVRSVPFKELLRSIESQHILSLRPVSRNEIVKPHMIKITCFQQIQQ